MKHNIKIITILILLFLIAQLVGLHILQHFQGQPLPLNIQPPEFRQQTSFLQLFFIILIATILAFVLAKFHAIKLWKLWFFLSVVFALTIAFSSFLQTLSAFLLALILAYFKIIKRSIIIHNFSELFIYAGIAVIFIPVLNIFSASILLIGISIYDMIAVWYTKHMIKLAKFQTKLKIFAGLLVPYKVSKNKFKAAILGGGDIAFPIFFAGAVAKVFPYKVILIPTFATIALLLLFFKGKSNKFYPAMPFISLGCFAGLLLIYLI